MKSFSAYIDELEEYTEARLNIKKHYLNAEYQFQRVKNADSDELNKHLRDLVLIDDLRKSGVFFTGDNIANQAVESLLPNVFSSTFIVDPACGTGNLLLACSRKLTINQESLRETLFNWGKILAGYDIHPNFIIATKLRLAIEALNRGAIPDISHLSEVYSLFNNISVGDALRDNKILGMASHVIVNPPYLSMKVPDSIKWSSGKTNVAAVFIQHIIDVTNEDTRITAILPDVLRSGSRYSKWRELVCQKIIFSIDVVGKFDEKTDVDVFILNGIREENKKISIWYDSNSSNKIIGDYFELSVGPVVDYRDPHVGKKIVFLCPKDLKVGEVVFTNELKNRRQFTGRLFKPPFIAIKRTSSPKESIRSSACIIEGDEPVAVENHIIIAYPKNESGKTCQDLLRVLGSHMAKEYLDKRIRCRHLTISSIKEIPWRI